MIYILLFYYYGNSKWSGDNDRKYNLSFQWTKSSTLTSFHLSRLQNDIYSKNIYSDGSFYVLLFWDFFLWFVYLHHDHYTCCQHPNVFVRVVPNYCKFIRSCWLRLRIFLYICSVLDCYLLCGVFLFSLWTKLFSVKLKPKGVLF